MCMLIIKKENILTLGEGSIQGLDDKTLSVGTKYRINFIQPNKRFVLNLHYNGSNSLQKPISSKQKTTK